MDWALHNKKDLYPCELNIQTASTAQVSIANYIKELKVCIKSKFQYRAFITQVTTTQLLVQLRSNQNDQQIIVRFSNEGKAQSQSQCVDINNSYITFIPQNKESVIIGSYNILLVAECVLYVPIGLRLTCTFGDPAATGVYTKYAEQEHIYVFNNTLNFISGYNCQPIFATDQVILAAGVGLGKGSISAETVADTLGSAYAGGIIKQVKGIRAINGQLKDVNILTVGSVGLRQSLSENTLTLTFSALQNQEQ